MKSPRASSEPHNSQSLAPSKVSESLISFSFNGGSTLAVTSSATEREPDRSWLDLALWREFDQGSCDTCTTVHHSLSSLCVALRLIHRQNPRFVQPRSTQRPQHLPRASRRYCASSQINVFLSRVSSFTFFFSFCAASQLHQSAFRWALRQWQHVTSASNLSLPLPLSLCLPSLCTFVLRLALRLHSTGLRGQEPAAWSARCKPLRAPVERSKGVATAAQDGSSGRCP